MTPLLLALPGNEAFAAALAAHLAAESGEIELRHFPDGETHVRILSDTRDREVAIVCTLHRPDERITSLLFLAATARDLGSKRVGLIAPYLAYMRQDRRFDVGEGITSHYFAALLARTVDWLVTVDPHLHRHHNLGELFPIPARAAHAAPAIAAYIREQIPRGIVIGPDRESEQWVAEVAREAGVPFAVLRKERHGDRDVRVAVPDVDALQGRTPIIVDDIISTAHTMIAVAEHLRAAHAPPPVCIGVHAVLDAAAERTLRTAGIADLITCNTIPHASNRIDIAEPVAAEVRTSSRASSPR